MQSFPLTPHTGIGEMSFYILTMSRNGRADLIAGTSLFSSIMMLVFNASHCYKKAFLPNSRQLTSRTNLDSVHLTGANYLRLQGMGALAAAQVRLCVLCISPFCFSRRKTPSSTSQNGPRKPPTCTCACTHLLVQVPHWYSRTPPLASPQPFS